MKLLWKVLPLFVFHCAFAQPDQGLPFIFNFPTSTYRQGPQNFAILQSKEGLLFVGNNNGLLLYDGVKWQLITVQNKSEVHALAQDEGETIYVGAQGDFGYLEKTTAGEFHYRSLLHLLDSSYRKFNDVWSIHTTQEQVIFRSTNGLYLYNKQKKTIDAIPFQTTKHRSFLVRNEVWVRLENGGLFRLNKNALLPVPDGESLAHEPLNAMFPFGDKQILLISEKRGLLLYDEKTIVPIENPVNSLLINQNCFGKMLENGHYAVGTRANGLLIIDAAGEIVYHIGKREGLANESIWAVEEDIFTRNLWIACNN